MKKIRKLLSKWVSLPSSISSREVRQDMEALLLEVRKKQRKWGKKKLRLLLQEVTDSYCKVLTTFARKGEERIPSPMAVLSDDRSYVKITWDDGTETKAVCDSRDTFDKQIGLAICIAKKTFGNEYSEIFNAFY